MLVVWCLLFVCSGDHGVNGFQLLFGVHSILACCNCFRGFMIAFQKMMWFIRASWLLSVCVMENLERCVGWLAQGCARGHLGGSGWICEGSRWCCFECTGRLWLSTSSWKTLPRANPKAKRISLQDLFEDALHLPKHVTKENNIIKQNDRPTKWSLTHIFQTPQQKNTFFFTGPIVLNLPLLKD